jgi:hypothetical protein
VPSAHANPPPVDAAVVAGVVGRDASAVVGGVVPDVGGAAVVVLVPSRQLCRRRPANVVVAVAPIGGIKVVVSSSQAEAQSPHPVMRQHERRRI